MESGGDLWYYLFTISSRSWINCFSLIPFRFKNVPRERSSVAAPSLQLEFALTVEKKKKKLIIRTKSDIARHIVRYLCRAKELIKCSDEIWNKA